MDRAGAGTGVSSVILTELDCWESGLVMIGFSSVVLTDWVGVSMRGVLVLSCCCRECAAKLIAQRCAKSCLRRTWGVVAGT